MKGYFARKPITLEDLKNAKRHGDEAEIQVIAEVTLTKAEFENFAENLYEDYDFIAKHTAIAVESDGYDFARYAALVRI